MPPTTPDTTLSKKRRKSYLPSKSDREWLTGLQAMRLLGMTNQKTFRSFVQLAGIRTRCLPAETHVKFHLGDIEAAAQNAVRVGLHEPTSA